MILPSHMLALLDERTSCRGEAEWRARLGLCPRGHCRGAFVVFCAYRLLRRLGVSPGCSASSVTGGRHGWLGAA
jgi:hypothetical protein